MRYMMCKQVQLAKPIPVLQSEAERLPKEVREILSRLDLDVNRYAEGVVFRFIRAISQAANKYSHVLLIVGEWGLGKTQLGLEVIEKIAKQEGLKMKVKRIPFMNIINKYLNIIENKISMQDVIYGEILKALDEGYNIVFLDEMEVFLQASIGEKQITSRALAAKLALQELLNILKNILDPDAEGYSDIRGRVHLVLALTPEAYTTLAQYLRDMGIHGWLERRIDVLELIPLSKLDIQLLVETLLKDYYGFSSPWSIVDPAIVDVLWLVTAGNTGSIIKLLDAILQRAYKVCREHYGINCICKLDEIMLAKLLREVNITYTPSGSKASTILQHECIAELENLIKEDIELAKEFARLLLLKPINEVSALIIQHRLKHCQPRMQAVNIYKLPIGKAVKLFKNISDRLASRLGEGYEVNRVKAVLQLLGRMVVEGDDLKLLIVLPPDPRAIFNTDIIFSQRYGVTLHPDILLELYKELNGLTYQAGYILAPDSYQLVYSATGLTVIPFIKNHEYAYRIITELTKLKLHEPHEYRSHVIRGLRDALIASRKLKNNVVYVNIDGIDYEVEVKLIDTTISIDPSLESIVYISISEGEETRIEPEIRFASKPPGAIIARIELILPRSTAMLLAAASYAKSIEEFRHAIDYETLNELYKKLVDMLESAGLSKHMTSLLKSLVNYGIVLLGPSLVPSEEVIDGMKLILSGLDKNNEVNIDKLAKILTKIYKVRPYKQPHSDKWCDIPVPPVLRVDIEPATTNPVDNVKHQLREKIIVKAIELGLLKEIGNNVYRVETHPAITRIITILKTIKSIKLANDTLEKYYILPVENRMRNRVLRDLKSLISLTIYQGLLEEKENSIYLANIDEKIEKLRKKYEELLYIFENDSIELHKTYLSLIEKLGIETEVENLAVFILGKRKQVKTITINDIRELINELKYLKELNTVPALRLAIDTLRMAVGLARLLKNRAERVEEVLEELEKRSRELRTLVRAIQHKLSILGLKVDIELEEITELEIRPDKLMTEINEIINTASRYQSSREKFVSLVGEQDYHAWFEYRSCTKDSFHPLNYVVHKYYEKASFNIDRVIGKLKSIDYKLQQIVTKAADGLEKLKEVLKERYESLRITSIGYLEHVVREVEELASRIEEEHRRIEMLRRKIETTKQEINELRAKLGYLREELKQLSNTVHVVCSSIQGLNLEKDYPCITEEIDGQLREIVRLEKRIERSLAMTAPLHELLKYLERLKDEVKTYLENSEKEVRKAENLVKDIMGRIRYMLNARKNYFKILLEKVPLGVANLIEEFNDLVDEVENWLNNPSKLELANLFNEIDRILRRIEESVKDKIEREIGEGAYIIYITVTNELKKNSRLRLFKLINILESKTGLSRQQILKILVKLDEENYLPLHLAA